MPDTKPGTIPDTIPNRDKKPGSAAIANLKAVFDVLLDEIASNPALQARLRDALDAPAIDPNVDANAAEASGTKAATEPDAPDINAIIVLREGGAAALKARLNTVRAKEHLRTIAKRSGLILTGPAGKRAATRPQLIDAIVTAAEHYDRQRRAAAG